MKKLLPVIAVAILVGAGATFGGMKYAESKASHIGSSTDFSDFRNLSPEERRQRAQESGFGSGRGWSGGDHQQGGGAGFRGSGSRPLTGEIISISEDTFTVKLADDSTKIVFFDDDTQISKSVDGTTEDLEEDTRVIVGGDENPDGSYTAKTIQLPSPLPQ